MGKRLALSALTVLAGLLMPAFVYASSIDTQQQIILQKEQEQASRRAEQELQHRVSQSMTKTQQQGSRLEAFVLPKEKTVLRLSNLCFLRRSMVINLAG